jgi:hypothetical protein
VPCGGLTVDACVLCDLMPIALDRSCGRDPVGRSSPKGCSRPTRPPRMSQAAAGMKREQTEGLERGIRVKGIKHKCIGKIL